MQQRHAAIGAITMIFLVLSNATRNVSRNALDPMTLQGTVSQCSSVYILTRLSSQRISSTEIPLASQGKQTYYALSTIILVCLRLRICSRETLIILWIGVDLNHQSSPPLRQSGPDLTFTLTVGPQNNLHVGGHALGNLCTFNGLPFFSATGRQWIKERTGEDVNLEYTSPRPSILDPSTPNGIAHAVPLPDKGILCQLHDEWENSILSRMFPFVDRVLLESTVAAAYHNETSVSSPGADSARACIHAFTATCVHAADQQHGHRVVQTEDHLQTAHDLVPRMLHESVTIDGLQAVLMIVSLTTSHCFTEDERER